MEVSASFVTKTTVVQSVGLLKTSGAIIETNWPII
jgi:hypothetical protein